MGFREKVQPFVFLKWLPSLIASLRHYIALYQGNIVPSPGTKRYVGRENPHTLFYPSPFTKSPETPINTGVPRGEELAQPFTTLHPLFTWIVLFIGLQKISAHQLISTCTTAVGRAHISCYASAQQLLCGWRDRLFRLILLIFLATSKGYSEDY